ncbi:hypothetical protein R1flu_025344 [Riccia fluitans]|uniref:Cytochrome c-type biogenesis protein CcmE n=1 Tax=Riccia fluitans TaxID=41844 RepID=A0ABD1XXH6_9MARC
MRASHGQQLVRQILGSGFGAWAQNCPVRVLEKSASPRWCNAELSDCGFWRRNYYFSSLVGKEGGGALAPRGVGSTVKAVFQVPSSVQTFSRHYQIRGLASGFRYSDGSRVDIGARARQRQARRLWTIALSGTLVAGFIIIVLNTFQENMMFYITPSEALEKYYLDPSKNKFRLGGLVLEGSVHHFKTSADMEFVVTDLANEVLVRYRGALPDLFREGHSVVAEGFLRPIENYPARSDTSDELNEELVERAKKAGCYFAAVDVLAKHDEKYMPKEVAAAIEKNKAAQEAQPASAQPALLTTTAETVPAQLTKEANPTAAGTKKKGVAQTPSKAQKYEMRV